MSRNLGLVGCAMGTVLILTCLGLATGANPAQSDARLQKAYRFQQGGWTYVHLEGAPSDMGFQHGYLLAPEIADALEAIKLFDTHQTQKDWEFFRTTARQQLWPHIDAEYQQELQKIKDKDFAHNWVSSSAFLFYLQVACMVALLFGMSYMLYSKRFEKPEVTVQSSTLYTPQYK